MVVCNGSSERRLQLDRAKILSIIRNRCCVIILWRGNMSLYDKTLNILKRYYPRSLKNFNFYIRGDIPSRKLTNAINAFAKGVDRSKVIGFYDTTAFRSGKEGYLFTDTAVYWLEMFEKPKKLIYRDIASVDYGYKASYDDTDSTLVFKLYGGETVEWSSGLIVKTPFYNFFTEILKLEEIHASTGEVSDFYDRMGFIDKILTDPVYEGKERGYKRAAREYTYAFSQVEQQYNTAMEFYRNQKTAYDRKTDTFIQMLDTLEKQRESLEKQVSQNVKTASAKTGLSVGAIKGAFSASCYAFRDIPTVFDSLPSIYDMRMQKAEKDGYLEARAEFLSKIEKLKQNLRDLCVQGDNDIKKYQSMIEDVLCDITDEQLKIADLRLLI